MEFHGHGAGTRELEPSDLEEKVGCKYSEWEALHNFAMGDLRLIEHGIL
jgi:hypothetical protein